MTRGVDHIGITVVFFCHDGQGNFLFNKRSKNCRDEHGRWDPGGGAVEFGETVVDTLKKEIKEEYSAKIVKYEFIGYQDVFRTQNKQKTHWLALVFKVLVDRTTVKNGEPKKFDQIGWFALDKVPHPQHTQLARFLDEYRTVLE